MNKFKHEEYFDYKVRGARSNNCILIDAHNWLVNTSNNVVGINSRGGIANNFITEVLDTNIENEKYVDTVEAGDYVMLTSVASRLYTSHTFSIPIDRDTVQYTDIPISHVVGKFTNHEISLPTFKLLGNYVMLEVLEDVDTADNGFVRTTSPTKTICKVYAVGPMVEDLKENDYVLIRDNISTNTMLNGRAFSIVSEDMVIGIFKDTDFHKPLNENLTLRHNNILMEEYQPDKALGCNHVVLPQYDASEDEGLSAIYSEETYKAILSNVDDIKENDLVYMDRAATSYITCLGIRYYVTSGSDFIKATVRGEI